MTVYVDEARYPFRRMVMCHMIADSLEELHAMSTQLRLRKAWFQNDARYPHYDLCKNKRQLAIKAGAVAITSRELVKRVRAIYPPFIPSEA